MTEIFESSIRISKVQPSLGTIYRSWRLQQHREGQGLKRADRFEYVKLFQHEVKEKIGRSVEDGARGSLGVGAAMELGSRRPRKEMR